MVRPRRQRRISIYSGANFFKPAGIGLRELKKKTLLFDELETLRLKDLLGMDQKDAALQMGISQSTFHRILIGARRKIADALVNSKVIKIEGGNFVMEEKNINDLKIAISASSKTIESEVDNRFGRCSYFLIITLKNGNIDNVETIENIQKDMRGGAGIAVAKMLADHNVDAILSENVGPRAMEVLNQFQISVYQANGLIKEAIKNFVEKKLPKLKG